MMKRVIYILALNLAIGNLYAESKWDIVDKTMKDWNVNNGSTNNQAWTLSKSNSGSTLYPPIATQKAGYVNINKTYTWYGNNYGFLTSPILTLQNNVAYSIEVKARLAPIDKSKFPDITPPSGSGKEGGYESNQISARLNARNLTIHLKYGDDYTGFLTINAGLTPTDVEKYKINTSEWHLYRFVMHADNLSFDLYIDDLPDPIYKNVPTSSMSGTNILRLGAETQHRCNMDIEYTKMGTGDLFSKVKIPTPTLSAKSQSEQVAKTIKVTIESAIIENNQKLLISLVDDNDKIVVNAIETTVLGNKAECDFTIPAGLKKGKYFVKATAPNGVIDGITVVPQRAAYRITSSAFEGKNLVTFGNSITSATNSWAYQTKEILRFGTLYNGAFAGACWYRRARLAQDGDSIWTQDYFNPNFAGFSNSSNTNRDVYQKIINNCAVIHVQKYLTERETSPDYIILSYGTNDAESESTMGDANAILNVNDFTYVNQYTMAGAIRWSIETLQHTFPETKIYVALPLQAKSDSKNNGNLKKITKIKTICDALSIPYFDCYNEAGITKTNEASYLRDGLHPNTAGQEIHADYIIKKIEETVNNQNTSIQNKYSNIHISISSNQLNIGQNIIIKSLANELSLSEVSLTSISGINCFYKRISGNEFSFQAPTTSGLYLMTVRLDNNSFTVYKIFVK